MGKEAFTEQDGIAIADLAETYLKERHERIKQFGGEKITISEADAIAFEKKQDEIIGKLASLSRRYFLFRNKTIFERDYDESTLLAVPEAFLPLGIRHIRLCSFRLRSFREYKKDPILAYLNIPTFNQLEIGVFNDPEAFSIINERLKRHAIGNQRLQTLYYFSEYGHRRKISTFPPSIPDKRTDVRGRYDDKKCLESSFNKDDYLYIADGLRLLEATADEVIKAIK